MLETYVIFSYSIILSFWTQYYSIFNLTLKFREKKEILNVSENSHEVGWNPEISERRLKELILFKQQNWRILMVDYIFVWGKW